MQDTLDYQSMLLGIFQWLNNNQGILSVLIFVATIAYGWISGTLSALRRKPKFVIDVIDGPSFICTFGVEKKYKNYDVHRTAVAVYLKIKNVGSAPADIESVSIGYKWAIRPFGILWWKYRLGWFWLNQQAIVLEDFRVGIGKNIKFYPFLIQKSSVSGTSPATYLEIGKATNGVVYFEQEDSYGACFPLSKSWNVKVKIRVIDLFGNKYFKTVKIRKVALTEARKFNPSFGITIATLQNEERPFDLPTDGDGNYNPPKAGGNLATGT